ncbi:MAG: PAS domain S-box protein [Desulfobacterales bacterium]|nr:PAS domain S-box protein [Desulfobacterales bacterium]
MNLDTHYLKKELYELVKNDHSIFDFLQSGSLDGIWYWDLESPENEWMSPQFWTTLGYDPKKRQHLASEWQDLINPEDLQTALYNFEKHCENHNHPYDQIVRYCHKNGSTVWVRCRGIVIRDNTGKPIRMLGAHTDITPQKRAEETLRLSEQFLGNMFDSIQDGISVLDNDLTIIRTNKAIQTWYTHMVPLEGKKCYHVYHGRSSQCEFCPVVRAFDTGRIEKGEVPLVQKGIQTGVLEISAFPMLDELGEPTGVIEYVKDISQRKEYEKQLSNALQDWQSTFDATNSIIWLLDKNNTILRSNKLAETVFKTPVNSIIGKQCWQVVHGTDDPIQGCPLCKSTKSLKRESSELQIDNSWFEVTVDPILNSDGELEKAVHILTDITERKHSELLLKEREQLYRSLFEKNIAVMLLIDPDSGNIVDANPSASSFYGYSLEKLKSMKITDLNVLSKNEVNKEMQKAKQEQRNYFNFRHRLADQSLHDVEVYSGPISVGGVPLLCSIIHDISERKALELEREELIDKLQKALDEIKTLKGIVPICSHCKKIRDDKGYWNILESYIQEHSEASFSHGMCPECSDRLYGDQEWYIDMKKNKK